MIDVQKHETKQHIYLAASDTTEEGRWIWSCGQKTYNSNEYAGVWNDINCKGLFGLFVKAPNFDILSEKVKKI